MKNLSLAAHSTYKDELKITVPSAENEHINIF
jgi:hypothetical protein